MSDKTKTKEAAPEKPDDITDDQIQDQAGDEATQQDISLSDEDIQDDEADLSPLERLEKERDGLKDQLYRAVAEMENVKRRAARDVEQAHKYGALGFLRDLTTPLDNMNRALDTAPADRDDLDETYKNILIGLEMTVQEIAKIMEKHGVKLINPEGEKFDYNLHQAMFEVPTDDAEPGTVMAVAQTGYVLHDRLIRPAMVGVAKAAKE
ncbi:MAG: nucleotide exchange factor GrpE [Candidatus Puniceispirillaceae bacterium]